MIIKGASESAEHFYKIFLFSFLTEFIIKILTQDIIDKTKTNIIYSTVTLLLNFTMIETRFTKLFVDRGIKGFPLSLISAIFN